MKEAGWLAGKLSSRAWSSLSSTLSLRVWWALAGMSLSDVGADRLVQMWVVPPQMPAQQMSAAGHYWRMAKATRKKTAAKTAKKGQRTAAAARNGRPR